MAMDVLDTCGALRSGGRVLNNAPRMKKKTAISNAPTEKIASQLENF